MILVLSPHGDDAELAMGGSMAVLARRKEVMHVVMSVSAYEAWNGDLITEEVRRDEAEAAAAELGVKIKIATFKDNHLIERASKIVQLIDDMIAEFKPEEVYTCLPWFNEDHRVLYQSTLAAMRKVAAKVQFWGYEMPQQELGFQMPEHGWRYRQIDMGAVSKKNAALTRYASQHLGEKIGPVSSHGALQLSKLRGIEMGVEYAERQLLLRGVELL